MNRPVHPILVFDSGVGGLTVFAAIRKLLPGAPLAFAADTAAFPYGRLSDEALKARVIAVVRALIESLDPALVVIACNTASTLVLPALRAAHEIPFVGTVPAIKPAAALTKSGLISVLATPGTVRRDYTAELIRSFAAACDVMLVGAPRLAALAEAYMRGESVPDNDILDQISGAFVERGGRRTDAVVLACTHYPWLLPIFERLAPWPVSWIDPAPAIARRVLDLHGAPGGGEAPPAVAIITSNGPTQQALQGVLGRFGIAEVEVIAMPLFSEPMV